MFTAWVCRCDTPRPAGTPLREGMWLTRSFHYSLVINLFLFVFGTVEDEKEQYEQC